jgi:altronate dehydratase
MLKAIMLNLNDTIATVLTNVKKNEEIVVISTSNKEIKKVTVRHDIPTGHKISIVDIKQGDAVKKFGETFGLAIKDIKQGEHVHVHNVVSNIGKND